jgi:hypothetical protein
VFVFPLSLFFLALASAQPALAQEGLREPPPFATPESFREDFLRFLDAYAEIAGQLGDHARQEQLATARRMMEGVTSEQIDQTFRHGVPNVGELLNATEALRQHLASAPALSRTGPRLPTLPGQPGILGACNVIAHDSNTTFILLTVQQAADVLLAASGRACDQVAVVAGFGANTALVCLPIEIALTAAKIPFELATFCAGEEDSSVAQGSFDRLGHLHGDLTTEAQSIRDKDDANTSTIVANDDSNRTAIVNNDNTNTANIILNGNANAMGITQAITSGFDAMEMREIENNLTARACPAWMYTPRFLDAGETVPLGGRFERVVAVLRTVIENARQLRTVHPHHLAKAQHAVDGAVTLSGARPPLHAKLICHLLQRAYQEATTSE